RAARARAGPARDAAGADADGGGERGAPREVRPRDADGRRVPRARGRDGARLRARAGREPRRRRRDPRSLCAARGERRDGKGGPRDASARAAAAARVGMAARLDTLAGCFATGLAPTGAADPYALRRACLGVLRTALDRGFDFSLGQAFAAAYDGYASGDAPTKL